MGEIFDEPVSGTTTILDEDNYGAIAFSQNALACENTKHIDLKWHILTETRNTWNKGLQDCGIYLRTG
jgi:hypothetical protein